MGVNNSIRQGRVEITIPFYDLDPMQVVWHGNCLNYFEMARAALFDSCGLDLYRYHEKTGYLFPVVRTRTKHIHPLRFRDRIACTARLTEIRRKLVVEFEITLVDDGTLCVKGTTEQVAVHASDFKLELAIPDEVQRALGGAE